MTVKKVTLLDIEKRGGKNNPLVDVLYGMGLATYSKSEHPLIIEVAKIFLENKDKPLKYADILRNIGGFDENNDNSLDVRRSHVVKICRKLSALGIIEETAVVPNGKKRWERAYRYNKRGFERAVEMIRKQSSEILDYLEQLSREIDNSERWINGQA